MESNIWNRFWNDRSSILREREIFQLPFPFSWCRPTSWNHYRSSHFSSERNKWINMNILLLIILIMLSFSLSLISRICFFFLSLSLSLSYLLPPSFFIKQTIRWKPNLHLSHFSMHELFRGEKKQTIFHRYLPIVVGIIFDRHLFPTIQLIEGEHIFTVAFLINWYSRQNVIDPLSRFFFWQSRLEMRRRKNLRHEKLFFPSIPVYFVYSPSKLLSHIATFLNEIMFNIQWIR